MPTDRHFSNTGYGYQYENGGVPFIDYRILKQTIENNFPYYGMSKDYDRFVAFYASGTYTYDSKYNLPARSVMMVLTGWVNRQKPAGCLPGAWPVHGM